MGLHHRINPVGIDVCIDKLQRDLFIELTKKFGWKAYESYDRVYRNKRKDLKTPEHYIGGNGEDYQEVLFNDKKNAVSFFLADEKRSYDDVKFVWTQGVSLIVQSDLSVLFPAIKHRPDEEMIDNVVKAIKNKGWEARLTEVITGIENVYASLKIDIDENYTNDMGTFAIARFNFKILYTNTNCQTTPLK